MRRIGTLVVFLRSDPQHICRAAPPLDPDPRTLTKQTGDFELLDTFVNEARGVRKMLAQTGKTVFDRDLQKGKRRPR